MTGDSYGMKGHMMTAHSGTIQSETDPGKGHEQHQLAVLLPPSSNVYAGLLTYSASENVQLVALHGPLKLMMKLWAKPLGLQMARQSLH